MTVFDLEARRNKILTLEQESVAENFWQNNVYATEVMKQLEEYRDFVNFWGNLRNELTDLQQLASIVTEEDIVYQELCTRVEKIEEEFKDKEFQLLMNGKYDSLGAILSIRAGAGGVDAQDFAGMLLRMYLKYCEGRKYQVGIVQQTRGEEMGVKKATIVIRGYYAYGYLKNEAGVHRLVRLSPFNADNLRQTSFVSVEILPEIRNSTEVKINTEDIKIDTFRSGGAGGQSVNKTDSAVRVTHLPTGIVVVCQSERSQLQNKEQAMDVLRSKLCMIQEDQQSKERKDLLGDYKPAEWSNQVRSYVLHPYKLVKDHRTGVETVSVENVLEGDLDDFIKVGVS